MPTLFHRQIWHWFGWTGNHTHIRQPTQNRYVYIRTGKTETDLKQQVRYVTLFKMILLLVGLFLGNIPSIAFSASSQQGEYFTTAMYLFFLSYRFFIMLPLQNKSYFVLKYKRFTEVISKLLNKTGYVYLDLY